MMRVTLFLVLFTFVCACAVAEPPPRRYLAPPPAVLTYEEAVQRGLAYCESRRLECTLREAHLAGNRVWRVHLRVYGPMEKGHLHLDYDAYTGALRHSEVRLKERYGPQKDEPERDPYGSQAHGDD
jgi:hypothetical protein